MLMFTTEKSKRNDYIKSSVVTNWIKKIQCFEIAYAYYDNNV